MSSFRSRSGGNRKITPCSEIQFLGEKRPASIFLFQIAAMLRKYRGACFRDCLSALRPAIKKAMHVAWWHQVHVRHPKTSSRWRLPFPPPKESSLSRTLPAIDRRPGRHNHLMSGASHNPIACGSSGHKSPCRPRSPYKQNGEVCFLRSLESTHSGTGRPGPARIRIPCWLTALSCWSLF